MNRPGVSLMAVATPTSVPAGISRASRPYRGRNRSARQASIRRLLTWPIEISLTIIVEAAVSVRAHARTAARGVPDPSGIIRTATAFSVHARAKAAANPHTWYAVLQLARAVGSSASRANGGYVKGSP